MLIGLTGSSGILGSVVKKYLKNYNITKFTGNIKNKREIIKWLKKKEIDAIIHLAAVVPTKMVNQNKLNAKKVNFYGTKNLVDSIIELKKKKYGFFMLLHPMYIIFLIKKLKKIVEQIQLAIMEKLN